MLGDFFVNFSRIVKPIDTTGGSGLEKSKTGAVSRSGRKISVKYYPRLLSRLCCSRAARRKLRINRRASSSVLASIPTISLMVFSRSMVAVSLFMSRSPFRQIIPSRKKYTRRSARMSMCRSIRTISSIFVSLSLFMPLFLSSAKRNASPPPVSRLSYFFSIAARII